MNGYGDKWPCIVLFTSIPKSMCDRNSYKDKLIGCGILSTPSDAEGLV